jgi:hypothetical protein
MQPDHTIQFKVHASVTIPACSTTIDIWVFERVLHRIEDNSLVDIQNWCLKYKGYGKWHCLSYPVNAIFLFSDKRDALMFVLKFGGEVRD